VNILNISIQKDLQDVDQLFPLHVSHGNVDVNEENR
jgi:hypothetical protein